MKTTAMTLALLVISASFSSAASLTVTVLNDKGTTECTASIALVNDDIPNLTKMRFNFGGQPQQQPKNTPPPDACTLIKAHLQPAVDRVITPSPAVVAAQAALQQAITNLKAAQAAQPTGK